MASPGNLPQSTTVNDSTTNYFNNYFKTNVNVSQNVDDAVIGFFQSVTGSKEAGINMAAAVLYTAANQGLDPMLVVDELRALKTGKKIEVKDPIDAALFVDTYNTYQEMVLNKSEYDVGQLFYIPLLNVFYQLQYSPELGNTTIATISGYKAEKVVLTKDTTVYNYFEISYVQEQNELNSYLTLLLNLNRVNTSLLGISNSPQTNKYIQRAILP